LELGTGTGLATAALLAGMSDDALLVTVDVDAEVQGVAREQLGHDTRVAFVLEDGLAYIQAQPQRSFDLVFADAMPGKYEGLDDALSLVRDGAMFIGDDILPQATWPVGDPHRVEGLGRLLQALGGWSTACVAWGSGYVMAVRMSSRCTP
ncbi:MAG: O-methyltransferase, partial [bacterium]